MGIGKPVMVTDGAETSAFPEGACVRIDPGIAETAGVRDLGPGMWEAMLAPPIPMALA